MSASKLLQFLNGTGNDKDNDKKRYGRKAEGDKATHTSMTGGSWAIPDDDIDEFYRLYCDHIRNHGPLHMTEKSTRIGAARIDLDFKYDGRHDEHLHKQTQVVEYVKAYMLEIKKYLVVSDNVEIFVSEKPEPTYYAATEKKPEYSKSGLHIVIPGLKTNRFVEEDIRRNLIKRMPEFFPDLPLSDKWEKVYDPDPLAHTKPWTLLGSKKKEGTPYQIKYILDWDPETGEVSIDNEVPILVTPELLSKMTVRSPASEETDMTEEAKARFAKKAEDDQVRASMGGQQRGRSANREEGEKKGSRASTPERNAYREPLSEEKLRYIRAHVENLAESRYNTYDDWIKVGICLKNIHPEDLESLYFDFSANYKDFKEREVQAKWNSFSFRTDGPVLSERSLLAWSRLDNAVGYEKIEDEHLDKLIAEAAVTSTEYDMAKVVYAMYREEFKCARWDTGEWYCFPMHVWRLTNKGVGLLKHLSNEVRQRFLRKENEIGRQMEHLSCSCTSKKEPNPGCESCKKEAEKKKYAAIQIKLKTHAFKKNVMEECKLHFLDEDLLKRLDENKNLIAFNNGVLDTLTLEFRPGKSDDYLSFTTEIDYYPDRKYSDYVCWGELNKFLTSILPDPDVREYFLAHLATCMVGGNPAQKFHILTGSGSNGKSMLMILMATCLGTYACKAPISLLTQERGKAGQASPELARMKGKRFVTMQEPEQGANIKTGIMKELSSCEKMTVRDLFAGSKDMIDVDLQAHFHLSCNDKPKVDAQDGGTWRRLCVINFPNKFVANPTKPNELPEDKTIQIKVESTEWAECMMNYLIALFREGNGFRKLTPPAKVLEYTNEYKDETDVIGRFIREYVHELEEGEEIKGVTTGEMNRAFQDWKRENQLFQGSTTELRTRMETTYGKYPGRGGWTSFRFGAA
jgi:P4 family phage/plasmid primase-like protien